MAWRRELLPVAGAAAISLSVWSAPRPGPTLAVVGGVHGDEPEGVLAADALTREPPPVERGTLLVVPVAHPAAFAAGTRCCPAGGNLARAFPGDTDGAPVERVAAALRNAVLDRADALVDLHTAGRAFQMPLLAGYAETGDAETDAASRRMATAFGARFVWRHREGAPGRTLSVMADRRKPAVYVEAGGGGALSLATMRSYRDGVAGAARCLGMSKNTDAAGAPDPIVGPGNLDSDALTAPRAGFFAAAVAAGDRVSAGQTAGWLLDLGRDPEPVAAPRDGVVMFLRHDARVEAGTPLILTAEPDVAGAA